MTDKEKVDTVDTEDPMINHPTHYTVSGLEPIEVMDSWGFGFFGCIANAIKYISRASHKDDAIQDLEKAEWYLNHAVEWMITGSLEELPFSPFTMMGSNPLNPTEVANKWGLSEDFKFVIHHIGRFATDPTRDVLERALVALRSGIEEVRAEQ